MENHERDISLFRKAYDGMIAKNEASWSDPFNNYRRYDAKLKDYTLEEVDKIINSGSLAEQQKLSRNYFYKDGFYKRLIIHYATLLKYVGLLIPNPSFGKSLSTSHIQKRYFSAMDFIDNLMLPDMLTNCSIRALVDGSYYGVIQQLNKSELSLLDLPSEYCRSNFKDTHGNDIIEFNVSYFYTILDSKTRKEALAVYPKIISSHFTKYKNGKVASSWVKIPADIGVCFPFFNGSPLLLNVIPATIQYEQAVETERERDLEEIRKILVQKIPHNATTNELLFEPDEAEEMHRGTVGMMKGNKNISVLTTYADVDSIVSKTTSDSASNNLEKMMQNIYYEASASSQIFSPTGNLAVETSIKNDISLMMIIANKYSRFLTNIINSLFGNANISFKYIILPISEHNASKYIEDSFKLAQSGYSFLLPALAMGLSQRDLSNIKDLENDTLKLTEKLKPLSSAYTQSASAGESGAPTKPIEDKAPKTIQNEESIDKTGGSQ